ncbi:MAG TPA: lysophospholipid acyltransferase family protein, partial [Moraxellaceae bacterium]
MTSLYNEFSACQEVDDSQGAGLRDQLGRYRETLLGHWRGFLSQRATDGEPFEGPDAGYMQRISPLLDFTHDRYFRVETTGWEHLPEGPCIIVGVHAGTWLTVDAWMLVASWWKRFGDRRILHGTAHDVLMAMPGFHGLYRGTGVVRACRDSVQACLGAGHSVVIWPGGERDSMRSWKRRHEVEFAERKGFIRQAIQAGVPIVPVATTGGSETVFVLSEGRWLARGLGLKRLLRSEMMPVVAGLPFGVWPEIFPTHIPLPAKIRIQYLPPIHVSRDSRDAECPQYLETCYQAVKARIQQGVD